MSLFVVGVVPVLIVRIVVDFVWKVVAVCALMLFVSVCGAMIRCFVRVWWFVLARWTVLVCFAGCWVRIVGFCLVVCVFCCSRFDGRLWVCF